MGPARASSRRAGIRLIVKQLDALCREYVFLRDRNQCVRCGKKKNLQWAHVYSRRYRSVRWEPLNSMVLCAGCHLAWHHRPLEAVDWWESWIGVDKINVLRLRFQSPQRIDQKGLLLWFQEKLRVAQ
jgi:hypothetical protein